MGGGRTLLLGDIGNRLDIEDSERDIASFRQKLHDKARGDRAQEERPGALEVEDDQVKLYFPSSIRLLVGKGLVSPAELGALVEIIGADEEK
jgi:hypothetical protein